MKISINWMLDHIATPLSALDVGLIVAKFNVHTAEIESYDKFELDIQNLFLVSIFKVDQAGISVVCDELDMLIELPYRNDVNAGQLLFVRRKGQSFAWESLKQYSSTKDGLFPAVDCPKNLLRGGWKQHCEDKDYIVEVDNKSINHRPDLWGHRGIAREIAAFMGWQLKPIDQMIVQVPQLAYEIKTDSSTQSSLSLEIKDTTLCARLAALYCNKITHKASQIWMAMRLARVDSKPINSMVDITNYVMFDLSQPMHVFDADNFLGKKIVARAACVDETLELLDGHQINLTVSDIILTDGQNPVALAGVMGGKRASFNENATSIIIESGSFQAAKVRNSAARVKITSESSTRFAKQLDPMQNVTALLRFVALAQGVGVIGEVQEALISLGKIIKPSTIVISHDFIENRLGIKLALEDIVTHLVKLEFLVVCKQERSHIFYEIEVPTFRTTKDITLEEDIVEEIARLYGFENIIYKSPVRQMKSFNLSPVMRLRKIKEYCAFAMNMIEVRDYLFYDESFLKRLNWYPTDSVAIKNPVSENWKVLVTSLVPHLLKSVELNHHAHEQINFFECNNIWHELSKNQSVERKSLAGIFFGQKDMNFYDYKAQMEGLFAMLDLKVVWRKAKDLIEPWFDSLQVADIVYKDMIIGRAGMISSQFTRNILKGSGFVFELDAHQLIYYTSSPKKFLPWSKYQAVAIDMSILINNLVSAEFLESLIMNADKKIDQVRLLDYFEKDEWAGKRSLTFRYRICDFEQNLTKEVIESITEKVIIVMKTQGAEIR